MNNLNSFHSAEFVFSQGGKVFTNTRIVAKYFKKNHKDILRKIKKIDRLSEFGERNFTPTEYITEQGKSHIMYNLSEAGFAFLVMGFTGQEADLLKIRFLNEFERMALALQQQQTALTDQHVLELETEIADLKKRLPRRWTPEESKVAIECYFELGQRIRVIADRLDRTYNSTKSFIHRVRKAMEAA